MNMRRLNKAYLFLKIIAFIIITISSSKAYTQDFNTLTSKIFFNVDLKNKEKIQIADFNSKSELIPKKDTGWTSYPPLDENDSLIPYFIYDFYKNPYFVNGFDKGRLMVLTKIKNNKVIGMT